MELSRAASQSQRGTEGPTLEPFLSWGRISSDAREQVISCMATGLSLEWVQRCGKQTSEGQEGKENGPRRETPVTAVTFRTVTQQKGGLALSHFGRSVTE